MIADSCDDDGDRASVDLDGWDSEFYDTHLADRLVAAAEAYFAADPD